MKVDAPAAPTIDSVSALPTDAPRVTVGTSKVPEAIAEAPVPVVGAAKAPPSVASRLDGAAEKNLRAVLAQLKEDASPKALQLAVNKLAAHARQDVHAALKAMLGGHADAVAAFVKTDHFDFARAELKAIAAKLPARVVETTERAVDFDMGVVAGATPLPALALFGHSYQYEMGQRMGAALGLAADAAAFLAGSGMTGGGAAAVVGTGGAALVAGVVVSQAGLALAGAASAGAAYHGSRFLHPLPAAVFGARATNMGAQPCALNEQHIFCGEVTRVIAKLSKELRAEQKRLAQEKESRPLTLAEQKLFETKPLLVAQGFHLESSGGDNARVIESTRTRSDRNGVYMAAIEIHDATSNEWVRKDAMSSFFPASYSEADVRRAIEEAYASARRLPDGAWVGTADRMDILLMVDDGDSVAAAYPIPIKEDFTP